MMSVPQALAMALAHHQAGRLAEAEQIYGQILRVDPNQVDALQLLGVIAGHTGRAKMAFAYLHAALRLKPDFAEVHNNLGNVLLNQRQLADAVASFQQALRCKPDFAEAHNNLGMALREQGKLAEAAVCFEQALRLQPDFPEAHNNLGSALREQGKLAEAVVCLEQALSLAPDFAEAHHNLGLALREQGKLTEAVARSEQALRLNPDLAEAYDSLAFALREQGMLAEAIAAYRKAVQIKPGYTQAHSNLLYTMVFCPEYDDAAALYEEHRRWNELHAVPLAKFLRPHGNDRSGDRRLRVAYISANFRDHAETYFTIPLFSAHDHRHFEIFVYSAVTCPDSLTAQFRSHADVWRDIVGLSDEEVAELVRADSIDILVDLTLHMGPRSFLLVFARKPAPVQVCWLAYQGTTGLTTMDYRLTDPHIDPPGLDDRYYSETSVRLPETFWCYDPLTSEPAVNALPALEKGHVTFGSLNSFYKVNAAVLKLWARVLGSVDRSRLLMAAPDGPPRQHARELLEKEGIAAKRVLFVGSQPRAPYLERYHHIDIGLDTFPYNGQTTTLDAFWMGVPVLTMVGRTAVGRAGASLLRNLGLPELVAETPDRFVQLAAGLASNLPWLSRLRATLRDRLRNSPLMDAPRFARNIEAAYRSMWDRWTHGER
jgi:predicted O-linked N-acetylglucosamine transferase (SPINDLY family)